MMKEFEIRENISRVANILYQFNDFLDIEHLLYRVNGLNLSEIEDGLHDIPVLYWHKYLNTPNERVFFKVRRNFNGSHFLNIRSSVRVKRNGIMATYMGMKTVAVLQPRSKDWCEFDSPSMMFHVHEVYLKTALSDILGDDFIDELKEEIGEDFDLR